MGRDIQPIKISGEDRRKYRDKVRRSLDVLARMLREGVFEADPSQVGQEIELNLVDEDGARRAPDEARRFESGRGGPEDPERPRYLALMQQALGRAVARLSSRDRLRLGCYFVQQLTLAETGRVLKEHEATASRQLARTKRAIREDVERQLREDAGLNDAQMAQCFASAADDPGPLDLTHMLSGRKESAPDRSYE